jgi:hypothetical protein
MSDGRGIVTKVLVGIAINQIFNGRRPEYTISLKYKYLLILLVVARIFNAHAAFGCVKVCCNALPLHNLIVSSNNTDSKAHKFVNQKYICCSTSLTCFSDLGCPQ